MQEARYRIAQASSAYDAAKALLLNNPGLKLSTRAALFSSGVTSTLFNLEQWIPGGKAWGSLCCGYSRLVRRLLMRPLPALPRFATTGALGHRLLAATASRAASPLQLASVTRPVRTASSVVYAPRRAILAPGDTTGFAVVGAARP